MNDSDIRAQRLAPEVLARNFGDIQAPFSENDAIVESMRCYYCYDAPCIEACPTGINVPSFIQKISTGDIRGAAVDILSENIMGGICARVCPTEVLCEQACVRCGQDSGPVKIGLLQRYATDILFARGEQPFSRAPATGQRIAIVGAGPAGLSCAHRAAMLGHECVVFDSNPKPGGLNEYGIAAYKVTDNFASREVAFILSLGGISLRQGCMLGRDVSLLQLCRDYDAVFLGVGLTAARKLNISGETLAGVEDAIDFIARLRQARNLGDIAIGRRVVVIGGGNTAIDAAVQSKRLGAADVTMIYRRGREFMKATRYEQELALTNGVRFLCNVVPLRLIGSDSAVAALECAYTDDAYDPRLHGPSKTFQILADQVFKAIGQEFSAALADAIVQAGIRLEGNRIAVDKELRTSLPGVWAGGDCVNIGEDLTVTAVEHGKRAAESIHRFLSR